MANAQWQHLWNTLTTPLAVDVDEARREYMTKVISLIMALVAVGLMLIFLTGYLLGFVPVDSVLITLGLVVVFGGAWWLAYKGHWRRGGYILPATIFLTAVYGNWIGGAGAPAMVLYALAIVLTAILQGEHTQWITLVLSLIAYLAIGLATISGHITQLRFPETAFANRVLIVVGGYVSLAALLWFLINQFRRALAQTRIYADQLMAANRQLEQEIGVRQQTAESLRQSNQTLQALAECSPLAIIILELAGQVLFWNHAAEELYGWTSAEMLGRVVPWAEGQDHAAYQALITRLLNGETLTNLEVARQRRDGSAILVNLSIAPLRDAHGTITAFMSITVDITESHRAKVALYESEQRFRLFMQHFPGLAYIKDAATRVLFANQGFQDYLGLAPDEILGKTNAEIFPAEFGKQITADDLSVLESGGSKVLEESYAGRVWSTYKFIIAPPDKPTLLGGFTLDITERKQTEEALRQSRNLLQTILDTIPVRVFWKDHNLRYLGCNRPFALDAGFSSPEQVIGKDDYQLGRQEQAELYRRDDRQVLESGQPKLNYEEPQVGADGQHIWVRTSKVPLHNLDGTIEAVLGTYEDITDRKRSVEALSESEERYRRLVEVSPVAMWINQAGILTYMNPAALRLLGATDLQQVVGRAALDFVHPDYHAIVAERITQVSERGKTVPLIAEKYIRLDGTVVDVEVTATPFTTTGGYAMQVLFQDITERKQAEAERERLIAELERRNAELERFVYTVSHDLKSPLVTIMGFLGYVQKDALAGDLSKLQLDLERITTAANRMQHLLHDLLELSRIGRIMNPFEVTPLAVIVQEAVELVRGRIEAAGVQIEVQPELPVIQGDRARLVEVLQNLIDNACKFMGDQPEPRVVIGWRGIDRDGRLIVFVRDNGIGIESLYREKVFGLFDKLDPKSEGTGIGLAIVKRIVEVHGGSIWVESEGRQTGATFCFTLPGK